MPLMKHKINKAFQTIRAQIVFCSVFELKGLNPATQRQWRQRVKGVNIWQKCHIKDTDMYALQQLSIA